MRLKKVRKTFWELVMKWMTLLCLMKPNISLLLLGEKNLLHPLLPTLKHPTLILQVITSSKNVHYANLKASIDDYYNENIDDRDQTDQLLEVITTVTDVYKGLEVITQFLKDITNSVKDDP
nr:hypothetical protein [Tanacetum cinerariifolium]